MEIITGGKYVTVPGSFMLLFCHSSRDIVAYSKVGRSRRQCKPCEVQTPSVEGVGTPESTENVRVTSLPHLLRARFSTLCWCEVPQLVSVGCVSGTGTSCKIAISPKAGEQLASKEGFALNVVLLYHMAKFRSLHIEPRVFLSHRARQHDQR